MEKKKESWEQVWLKSTLSSFIKSEPNSSDNNNKCACTSIAIYQGEMPKIMFHFLKSQGTSAISTS